VIKRVAPRIIAATADFLPGMRLRIVFMAALLRAEAGAPCGPRGDGSALMFPLWSYALGMASMGSIGHFGFAVAFRAPVVINGTGTGQSPLLRVVKFCRGTVGFPGRVLSGHLPWRNHEP
jgi:hypothetical protein